MQSDSGRRKKGRLREAKENEGNTFLSESASFMHSNVFIIENYFTCFF